MMGKHRLPPPDRTPGDLYGPDVKEFGVVSWQKDQTSPPTAVGIVIKLATGEDIVLRCKSPRAVDDLIQMLLRHKRHVWPEAP